MSLGAWTDMTSCCYSHLSCLIYCSTLSSHLIFIFPALSFHLHHPISSLSSHPISSHLHHPISSLSSNPISSLSSHLISSPSFHFISIIPSLSGKCFKFAIGTETNMKAAVKYYVLAAEKGGCVGAVDSSSLPSRDFCCDTMIIYL